MLLLLYGTDLDPLQVEEVFSRLQRASHAVVRSAFLVNFYTSAKKYIKGYAERPLQVHLREHHTSSVMNLRKPSRESIYQFMCAHRLPFMNSEHRLFTHRTLAHFRNIQELNEIIQSGAPFLPRYLFYCRVDFFLTGQNSTRILAPTAVDFPSTRYGIRRRHEGCVEDIYFFLPTQYFDIFYDRINHHLLPKIASQDIPIEFPEKMLYRIFEGTPLLLDTPLVSFDFHVNWGKYSLATFEQEMLDYLTYLEKHHQPFCTEKNFKKPVPWCPIHYDPQTLIELYLEKRDIQRLSFEY